MKDKIYAILSSCFFYFSICYLIIAAYYYLSRSELYAGDEILFLSDLDLIREKGWTSAIEKNISIPFMLLVYPFTYFFKNFVALRLVNVLLVTSFIAFLWKERKERKTLAYLFFYIGATAFFFFGTNDTLFIISLSIFLIEVNSIVIGKKSNLSLALSALVVAIFTRQLFVIYLPVILYGLYWCYKKEQFSIRRVIAPFFLVVFFLFLNFPSLRHSRTLSYDKKEPVTQEATWTQRQYLAQIMVNEGELKFHSHPSWEETIEYLEMNGRNSLPKGIMEGVIFDLQLTMKEFFKDFTYIMIYHSRTVGLMLLSILFLAGTQFVLRQDLGVGYFVPISSIVIICIFSLIIISYVELRWLAPIFTLAIVYYGNLEKDNKVPYSIKFANILILILFIFYGSYGLLNKIL